MILRRFHDSETIEQFGGCLAQYQGASDCAEGSTGAGDIGQQAEIIASGKCPPLEVPPIKDDQMPAFVDAPRKIGCSLPSGWSFIWAARSHRYCAGPAARDPR